MTNARGTVSSTLAVPICPACGAVDNRRSFEKGSYVIWDCSACGHRFTPVSGGAEHVASVYSDEYFTGGGAGYPDYLAEGRLLREHGRRYGELLTRHAPKGRVLDVGSAGGFVLQGLADAGWSGKGVEPNATMAKHARDSLGMDVLTGTLEDVELADSFDAVVMVQVIGHFYDLKRALTSAARLTRPGGLWLIECWDRESVPAKLLGSSWHEYSPPSVVHWFTRRSLDRLAGTHGFVEIASGRPSKKIAVRHAKAVLEHVSGRFSRLLPTGLLRDDWVVPYPSLDVFWSLFRKENHTV